VTVPLIDSAVDTAETVSPKQTPMLINDILAAIPHRYPFVLVDRVTDWLPGQQIEGYKMVTYNEPFFQGHFPQAPIMPGVLQLEALAQLAGVLVSKMPEGKGKMGLFTGMNNIRFRKIVTPGDKLELKAVVQKIRSPLCKFLVEARVDNQITVEGEVSFTMVDKSAVV
jgi:3-hydroxyacyl-[acyl-carrier-protein] dehydratase